MSKYKKLSKNVLLSTSAIIMLGACESKAIDIKDDDINEIQKVATHHFEVNPEAETIPFGLKFIESQTNLDSDETITGTVTITWADSDADVD